MAPSLVNISRSCTSKVRLLSPFPTAVSIKQDAVVGKAEPIEGEPKVLVPEENSEESDNFHQMRRLTFESKPSLQDEHVMDTKPHTARSTGEADIEPVPAHLTDLFERTSKAISPAEKARIASLLTKFQDTFSRDEWAIGLTDLAEHSISTGDATPVKQPPRRVPLEHAEAEKKAIEDLKAKWVIRESLSPWASPIVLVTRKDGGVRPTDVSIN